MTTTILAFGIAKDIFGASSIQIEVPDNASAEDLKVTLEKNIPD